MNDQVVVVGGGPTGLMLAAELRVLGVDDVVVLERDATPISWSRALVLQRRSVEVFRQRGLHWFDDAPKWHSHNFGFVDLTRLNNAEEYIPFRVPQRRVEQLLERHCTELGVDLRRGHRVAGLTRNDAGVAIEVETADGAYRLDAGWLVGCDGGRSVVRKLAEIGFPGTASTCHGVTGDVDSVGPEHPDGIPPRLTEKGLFAVTPLDDSDLFRATFIEFGVTLPGDEVPVTVDELADGIERVTGERIALGEVHWLSRFGNATRQAAAYRDGRVLLAGDAAHIHFPSGGQGLNTGLQDAVNLGWKLAAEIHGWAPPGLLDSYHEERHPVGHAVCMYAQTQVALYHPLDRVRPLRAIFGELMVFDEVREYLLGLVTGVGIRYPVASPHPLAGARVPDATLTTPDGPRRIADLLAGGRGVLVDLDADGRGRCDASGYAGRVDHVVALGADVDLDAAVLLVRPDGYVAHADRVIDHDVDHEALDGALGTWFGEPDPAQRAPAAAAAGAVTGGPTGG